MSLKRKLFQILYQMPYFIKKPLFRAMVKTPLEANPELTFKIAETKDELEQAFKILHDGYVKDGYMKEDPSGLRVTKFHALPSTTTLVAKKGDEVIGTVSIIRKGPLGFPCGDYFDLSHLAPTDVPAEISSLGIKDSYRSLKGEILFPMLKFLFHYSKEYFGVSHYIITVSPKWIDFYVAILMFEKLETKIDSYDFANNVPAVGGILNLKTSENVYHRVYGAKKDAANLYRFFVDNSAHNMNFPMRKKCLVSDPVMTPEMIRYFYYERTNAAEQFTDDDLHVLREIYNHKRYLNVFHEPRILQYKYFKRSHKRFDVLIKGNIVLENGNNIEVSIQNVSERGMKVIPTSDVDIAGEVHLLLNLENVGPCSVKGVIVQNSLQQQLGVRVTENQDDWNQFISALENRLMKIEESHSNNSINEERKKVRA